MEISTMMLIVAAVTVALGAGAVAFRFVAGNRTAQQAPEMLEMSRTKLTLKLIALGLALFLGLAFFFLYSRGGG